MSIFQTFVPYYNIYKTTVVYLIKDTCTLIAKCKLNPTIPNMQFTLFIYFYIARFGATLRPHLKQPTQKSQCCLRHAHVRPGPRRHSGPESLCRAGPAEA